MALANEQTRVFVIIKTKNLLMFSHHSPPLLNSDTTRTKIILHRSIAVMVTLICRAYSVF